MEINPESGSETEMQLLAQIQAERENIYSLMNNIPDVNNAFFPSIPIPEVTAQLNRCSLDSLPQLSDFCNVPYIGPTDTLEKMKEEVIALQNEYDTLVRKEEKAAQELHEISGLISEMTKVITEVAMVAPINSSNIALIESNLLRRFDKEKRQLRELLNCLFPEDLEIRDMIAKLVTLHLTDGPDAYLTLTGEEGERERVTTLTRSHIFQLHLSDPMKIRMINLF